MPKNSDPLYATLILAETCQVIQIYPTLKALVELYSLENSDFKSYSSVSKIAAPAINGVSYEISDKKGVKYKISYSTILKKPNKKTSFPKAKS